MTTHEMKEKILREFSLEYGEEPYIRDHEDRIKDWLSSALDRYAMAVVEASVPEKLELNQQNTDQWWFFAHGSNTCRTVTLAKAREITNQV